MMFISQLSPFWEVLSMKLKIALSNSKWSILLFNIFGLNQRCYWLVNMRSRLPRSGKFFPSKLKSRIQETNWLIWFIHQLSYLNFFLFSKYVPSKKIYSIFTKVFDIYCKYIPWCELQLTWIRQSMFTALLSFYQFRTGLWKIKDFFIFISQ